MKRNKILLALAFATAGAMMPAVANAQEITDNQRVVGNAMNDRNAKAVGIPDGFTGTFKVGGFIANSMLADYVGCKIVGVRFYLMNPVGKSTAFVTTVAAYNGYISDSPVLSKELATTGKGWNYAMFDYSYTIGNSSSLSGFVIGYDFNQVSNDNPDRPIGVSGKGASSGFMIYGDCGDNGVGWYNQGTSYGNVMVQLIIERDGGFLAYDLALDKMLPIKFAKSGERQTFSVYCRNVGTAADASATFGVAVDGKEVGVFNNDEPIGSKSALIEPSFTMPEGLSAGTHSLAVYLKTVAGAAPEGNLGNDRLESTFKVYDESFPRQKQLVEHFTSEYCMYCPRGYNVLDYLLEKRDDVAWVAIHNDMSGESDEYTLDGNATFSYLSCASSLPSASFNRYYLDGTLNSGNTLGLPISYPDNQQEAAADMFSELLDLSAREYPSFTTIDLATDYDEATRQLNVKVSGRVAKDMDTMLGSDAVVTVYLTEDGLWGKQKDGSVWINKFPHSHTLRQALTSMYGEPVNAANGTYEKTFSTLIDTKCDASNMNVVAVVSRPMKVTQKNGTMYLASSPTDLWVDNTEMVKLGSSTTGISTVSNDNAGARTTGVYTLGGTYVGTSSVNLPKGVYIVNGKKVVK